MINGINMKRQNGAVLVVALVLLTVLTLIGVASMQSSSLELRAASNAQQYNIAFEAALSRIDFATSEDDNNPLNFLIAVQDVSDPGTWPTQTCNAADGCADDAGGDWTATAELTFNGTCTPGTGYSLEDGRAVYFRHFNLSVDAQAFGGSARSVQVQGVRHPSAGC